MISVISMGMGSVGISLAPIRVTMRSTSGNLRRTSAACPDTRMVSVRELPVNNRASMAKSPSSNSGMNSPPSRVATKSESPNASKAEATTIRGYCITRDRARA